MSNFTEFAHDLLARCKIPQQCSDCGNPHLEELALTGRGKLICRQDVPNIREACVSRIGWRVLDAKGNPIDSGPGITFKPTADMAN